MRNRFIGSLCRGDCFLYDDIEYVVLCPNYSVKVLCFCYTYADLRSFRPDIYVSYTRSIFVEDKLWKKNWNM